MGRTIASEYVTHVATLDNATRTYLTTLAGKVGYKSIGAALRKYGNLGNPRRCKRMQETLAGLDRVVYEEFVIAFGEDLYWERAIDSIYDYTAEEAVLVECYLAANEGR